MISRSLLGPWSVVPGPWSTPARAFLDQGPSARGESVRKASPVERPWEVSKNRSQAQGRGACLIAVSA